MPTLSGHNPTPEQLAQGQRTGQTTQALQAKWSKIRQCLEAQRVHYADMINPKLRPKERYEATRAWDMLEERIRILKGKVKAGTRNVSIREPHPSELPRRIAQQSRTKASLASMYADYQATQAQPMPDATPAPAPSTDKPAE